MTTEQPTHTPARREFHLRARLRAFLLHCCFSAVLITGFLWVVTRSWYPDILFRLEDVYEALRILVPVDAILGPVLTFLLYVPGKRGVKLDIALVALAQVLALAYGGHTIYQQRPAALVFAGDRFEVIPASKLDLERLPPEHFDRASLDFPFLAYALPAQTNEEFMQFVATDFKYQKHPERYRPVADHLAQVRERALDPARIKPEKTGSVKRWTRVREQFDDLDKLLFLPLEGTTFDWNFIVLERDTGRLAGYLGVDAWNEYDRSR